MNKTELTNTINQIQQGSFHYETLSADEFEDVVAESLIQNHLKCNNCSVKTRKRNPFDIIIEDKVSTGFKEKTISHYIECKNHNKELTLDVIGRPLCIAIKDKPDSVIFVNRYEKLAPDAHQYTDWLFNSYLLNRADFDVFTPEQLLNAKLFEKKSFDYQTKSEFTINLQNWSLYRESTFYKDLECTSSHTISKLYLDNECEYNLKTFISYQNLNQRKINSICLELKISNIFYKFNSFYESEIIGNLQEINFKFEELLPFIDNKKFELRLRINSSSGTDITETIQLPLISLVNNINIPDLRNELSNKYSKMLLTNNHKKILFIKGEGGIGKTYFCEEICKQLKKEQNYQTHIFPMSEENSNAIFLDLLYLFILPEDMSVADFNKSSNSRDFQKEYLESLTSLLGTDNIDYSKIIESIINNTIGQEGLEIIIRLIVDSISRSEKKKVLVFSNCQYMNGTISTTFKQFITALESKGWNKLQIFFEYRNTEEYHSENWENLESWINNNYSNTVENVELKPFKQDELYSWIDSSFINDNKEYISNVLLSKTGGNALFLTHLFEELKSNKVISISSIKTSSYKLIITSLREFEKNIEKLPSNISELLIYRLKFIDQNFKDENIFDNLKYFLGLASIFDLKLYREILLNVFELSIDNYNRIVRILVSKKILKDLINDENIFAHDMIRVSSSDFIQGDKYLNIYYSKVININEYKNSFELLISKAKLSEFINYFNEAVKYYDEGHELAKSNELFQWRHKFINELIRIIKNNKEYLENNKFKFFKLIDSYCWAEEHTGSYKNAVGIALDGISLLNEYNERNLRPLYPELYHKIIGLSIELINPKVFYENILFTIDRVEDLTKLGQILNRVILQCYQSGNFKEGINISEIALKLAPQSTDKCVYSVLCTDISSLYSLVEPEHSLKLCEKALNMDVEKRQIVHNQLSKLSIKMKIDLSSVTIDEINNIENLANELKMNNVSTTLLNLEACLKINSYQFEYAISLLKDAEFKSAQYDHDSKNIQIINNLLISYILTENYIKAEKYLIKLYKIIEQFINGFPTNSKDILNKVFNKVEHRFIKNTNYFYDKTYFSKLDYESYPNLTTLYIENIKEINYKVKNKQIKVLTDEIITKLNYNKSHSIKIQPFNYEKYEFYLSL